MATTSERQSDDYNHRVVSDSITKLVTSTEELEEQLDYSQVFIDEYNPRGLVAATTEQCDTLRHVVGNLPFNAYLLCVAELAERGSYYGISGILANFILRPLPPGSTTGAPVSSTSSENAGALGLDFAVSSAFTLLLAFLVYVVPLYGGYLADTRLGKFKAIYFGSIAGFFAHIFFVIAAIPSVIAGGKALAPTVIGIVTLAISTGFIRPNLLPLLMDQYKIKHDVVKVLPSGEKVIVDLEKTLERISLYYYWIINVGAFFLVATTYCARRIGYWLAFLVPTIMYVFLPGILFYLQSKLIKDVPAKSALSTFWKVLRVTFSRGWFRRYREGTLWEYAKPSNMLARGDKHKEITWDDKWVSDVRKTLQSCKIFMYFPMFNLCDNGLGNALNAQSGAMITKGIPNDLYYNFNALAIIVMIPIMDYMIYPLMRKYKVPFHPVWRITFGFFICAGAQAVAAVLQHFIYKTSPCGDQASTCDLPSNVNGWWEITVWVMTGVAECFANVTAFELAYSHSPPQMRGVVLALFLLTFAIAAAIGEAFTAFIVDPNLVRIFIGTAVCGYIFTFAFYAHFYNFHRKERQNEIEKESAVQIERTLVPNEDAEK